MKLDQNKTRLEHILEDIRDQLRINNEFAIEQSLALQLIANAQNILVEPVDAAEMTACHESH